MSIETIFQGSLFTSDFLTQSITANADWRQLDDAAIDNPHFPYGRANSMTKSEDYDIRINVLQVIGAAVHGAGDG